MKEVSIAAAIQATSAPTLNATSQEAASAFQSQPRYKPLQHSIAPPLLAAPGQRFNRSRDTSHFSTPATCGRGNTDEDVSIAAAIQATSARQPSLSNASPTYVSIAAAIQATSARQLAVRSRGLFEVSIAAAIQATSAPRLPRVALGAGW